MVTTWKLRILTLSILSLALASCSGTPIPIPDGADTVYYGNLVRGEKFGVAIGQSEAKARETLSAGGDVLTGKFECSQSYMATNLFSCTSGQQFLAFNHKQFGRIGMIVLRTTNGHISQIAWSFHLFPHVDF